MGDVGLDAVVRAINTLNGPVAAEERRAAYAKFLFGSR